MRWCNVESGHYRDVGAVLSLDAVPVATVVVLLSYSVDVRVGMAAA